MAIKRATIVPEHRPRAKPKRDEPFISRAADLPDARVDFDGLLDRGARLLAELRQLEARPKLSASAFLRQSMALAAKSIDQLDALEARIHASQDAVHVVAFISRMARQLREPMWTTLPTGKLAKLVNVFGSEETAAQLALMSMTVADALALAVREAVKRWPEAFGAVDDFPEHVRVCEEMREHLTKMYALLKVKYTAADVMMEARSLGEAERKAGHVVVRLKRFPGIHLGSETWPQEAVEAHYRSVYAPRTPAVVAEPEALPPETKRAIATIAEHSPVVVMARSASRKAAEPY